MRYKITKLDGRWSYRQHFEYVLIFSSRMTVEHGPLHFNDALKWFNDTYGWSAEVRDYMKIRQWVMHSSWSPTQPLATGILKEMPTHCNPHWSWTNGYDDLRIYVASSAELNFFQLKWPCEK